MTGPGLRRLPTAKPRWERDADVVVVGSGAAGIAAALAAARQGRRVLLLSKDGIGGGAIPLAQGGLAAAIGPGDNPALHQQDTLQAGAGLRDPAAVATLVAEAPGEITRLAGRAPSWSGRHCTWRVATTVSASSTRAATRSARKYTGCSAPPCWPARSRSWPAVLPWTP